MPSLIFSTFDTNLNSFSVFNLNKSLNVSVYSIFTVTHDISAVADDRHMAYTSKGSKALTLPQMVAHSTSKTITMVKYFFRNPGQMRY